MSTVDLILLGMVTERPQSAYDVHKAITFRNLSHWIKVGKATVFKNLSALEAKGLVQGETTRQGNMPPKTIYHITPAGYSQFCTMMREQAETDIPLLFDFNAVIANVNKVPYTDALQHLSCIQATLAAKKAFIEDTMPERQDIPLVGKAIMRQQVLVLQALLGWLEEFIPAFTQEYKKEAEDGKA